VGVHQTKFCCRTTRMEAPLAEAQEGRCVCRQMMGEQVWRLTYRGVTESTCDGHLVVVHMPNTLGLAR